MMKSWTAQGIAPAGSAPAEFAGLLREQAAVWAEVVDAPGASAD